ncbi:hypothetical protein SAMN02745225_02157, partial [Ferrithrix thermotolerans DSM 19514]
GKRQDDTLSRPLLTSIGLDQLILGVGLSRLGLGVDGPDIDRTDATSGYT